VKTIGVLGLDGASQILQAAASCLPGGRIDDKANGEWCWLDMPSAAVVLVDGLD